MLFALAAVIALILLVVWLLKVVFKVSSTGARGRNRRLAVVDTLVLDQKRQLLIVRRDNVEHLILTGGPQDVVVETGIAIAEGPAALPARRTATIPAPAAQHPALASVPSAPAPIVETVRPAAPFPKAEPGTLLEELQQAGHSGARKTRVSLRKTGLMRQGAATERPESGQNPDISAETAADSANEVGKGGISEGAALEKQDGNEANRG
nr:flagellar biosynthetic protein FliO [Devosia faecipullorum]